jgi:hypothetical protein
MRLTPAFVSNTWAGDILLAHRLAAQVQQHHPGAKHLFIGDGVTPDIPGAICLGMPHQKTFGQCHNYAYRMMAQALEMGEFDVLFQLDPDCYLHRPLWPHKAQFFGSLFGRMHRGRVIATMHGCCWGMWRSLVEDIVTANPFAAEDYDYPENQCGDGSCSEDVGFCLGVRKVYPRQHWQNWSGLGTAVQHPVKVLVPS